MEILVWIGAAVTLMGLAGLGLCVVRVRAARRAALPEAEMRRRLQGVIALNLGALLVSAIGLGLVMVGLLLSP